MNKILEKDVSIEGPNLYKRNGWYYLMLAEGGTGWNHGISLARSRSVTGPYELDPFPSILTAWDDASLPLQKAGHGELVETPGGEWYLAHLAKCKTPSLLADNSQDAYIEALAVGVLARVADPGSDVIAILIVAYAETRLPDFQVTCGA